MKTKPNRSFFSMLMVEDFGCFLTIFAGTIMLSLSLVVVIGSNFNFIITAFVAWFLLGCISYPIEVFLVTLRTARNAQLLDLDTSTASPAVYIYTVVLKLTKGANTIELLLKPVQLVSNFVLKRVGLSSFKKSVYELDYMPFYKEVVSVMKSKYNIRVDDYELKDILLWAQRNPGKHQELSEKLY